MTSETQPSTGEVLENPTVYVREVPATEISDILENAGMAVSDDQMLYAVHLETGERMAVFNDREAAFLAARHHGAEPVSVH
jgi:hypothetical protein